jgi:hypothetical protein
VLGLPSLFITRGLNTNPALRSIIVALRQERATPIGVTPFDIRGHAIETLGELEQVPPHFRELYLTRQVSKPIGNSAVVRSGWSLLASHTFP